LSKLAHRVAPREMEVCVAGARPRPIGRYLRPEFAQPVDPVVGRIARDDRGVDGADRYAGNPIRMNTGLAQRLVDSGLIGAKRAAALQHQGDNFKGKVLCRLCDTRLDLSVHDSSPLESKQDCRDWATASLGWPTAT